MKQMVEDCVIIGGGVAGLSCANQLVHLGFTPLLIEASAFPSHRICGEFLSHECLPILQEWEIPITSQIKRCQFFSGKNKVEFFFPISSGSCSRYILDNLLLERAKQKGARILTKTELLSLQLPKKPNDNYELILSNGQIIQAKNLIIGTGKIPGILGSHKEPKYFGFKAHFEGIHLTEEIEMYSFEGGYLGISSITNQTTNIACIVNKQKVQNPDTFMLELQEKVPFFKDRMQNARMLFPNWMVGQVPEFGIRKNSVWERVFWIGDAAGSIPPVCGEGLAIAISSGYMAADYFLKSNSFQFKKDWLKRYKKRFLLAKLLHAVMMHPKLSQAAIYLGNKFSFIPPFIWKMTRG